MQSPEVKQPAAPEKRESGPDQRTDSPTGQRTNAPRGCRSDGPAAKRTNAPEGYRSGPAGKRSKTPDQALAALMRLCARAERSAGDARRLMRGWGLAQSDAEAVLARLVGDRFIDDRRYAEAFVREKLRLSGWGAYKIHAALARKGIAAAMIDEALAQAEGPEMAQRLRQALERKARTVRYATPYELKTKLIRYGLSLGYDYASVLETASALNPDTDSCDDFF